MSLTERERKRLERDYDAELESAGMQSRKKLKKLIASNGEFRKFLLDAAEPPRPDKQKRG